MPPKPVDQLPDEPIEELEVEPIEEPQPEPRLVTIKFNGDLYEVPEHLANAWHDREEMFNRKLSEQATRIRSETRTTPPATRQDDSTRVSADPASDDVEIWASPAKALAAREARLRDELRQELRQELSAEEQRRMFWADFWSENEDLKGKGFLVNAVFQSSFNELRDLTAEEARQVIAERTREHLGQSAPTRTRRQLDTTRQVTSEPTRPSAPRRVQAPPSEYKAKSLSDIIDQRAEARRRAHRNLPPTG